MFTTGGDAFWSIRDALAARATGRRRLASPPASMLSLPIVLLLLAAVLPHPAAAAIHGVFAHGVASGDPTHESVIIWTRVTPTGRDQPGQWDPVDAEHSSKTFRVTWTVSTEPPESRRAPGAPDDDTASSSSSSSSSSASTSSRATGSHPRLGLDAEIWSWDPARVAASGVVVTTGATDWTVKVDVRGLIPGVQYHYAFNTTGDRHSPTGTFRLPPPPGVSYPPDAEPVRIAVFSCANWAWGHFHAYDAAARGWGGAAARLDAWLHLGDYYYEYGDAAYPAADEATPDRWASLDPRRETVSLADYRARHALHRTDPGLMALSASAPLVAMWDDHEIANNEWTDGAEDHQTDREGRYSHRVRAAIRAYHEWLPTREPATVDPGAPAVAYNRTVHFGDVASFVVMETRLVARTDPNANPAGNVFANASREIAASATPAPVDWRGSALERRLDAIGETLEAYRSREDKRMLGDAQTRWIERETRWSRDAGVRWQVYAQASIVMDAAPPDLEAGAAALDARRDAPKPPGGYATWAEALRAWTDWDGTGTGTGTGGSGNAGGGASRPARGRGGRAVPVASARALLAVGRHGINWNFDDWHGYAAERERFLRAAVPNANRALILGGDSHDAWAGIVPADPAGWGARGSKGIRGIDDDSDSDRDPDDVAIGAVEFDVPGITPPGAFEQAFPWCPTELIDEGHLAANAATMRFVKTGRRGFAMLTLDRDAAVADFVFTPSVRDETYAPECGGSFVASEGSDGHVRLRRRACPPLPRELGAGGVPGLGARANVADGRGGEGTATLIVVAVVFGAVGGAAGYAWPWRGGLGGGSGGGNGRGGGGIARRRGYDAFDHDDDAELELGRSGSGEHPRPGDRTPRSGHTH